MFSNVRYLNANGCDRITELVKKTGVSSNHVMSVNAIAALGKIKPEVAKEKLNALLEKIEKQCIKGKYNLVLKNLPEAAPLRDTNQVEQIGYPHMYDTFDQFGKLETLKIIRGTVYVKFAEESSCVMCHNTINNMQMGQNIVTTFCV
jgi:hypothetical protein